MRNPHALVEAPEYEEPYWLADPAALDPIIDIMWLNTEMDRRWLSRGLCFPHTDEGKQHAIEHAKAMLEAVPLKSAEPASGKAIERVESPTVRRIVGPTILLASGNYFDFLAPEQSTFTIEDVAQGLSNICRFAGQCSRFYSVAQHSVLVSQHVPPEFAFIGLMHDAAEAFIGDMTKPLKDILPDYRALEDRIEAAVLGRFGLPHKLPPEVKEIDVVMLATEQQHLMRNRDDWNYTRGRKALDIVIPQMGPAEAKVAFLARYEVLRAGRGEAHPAPPANGLGLERVGEDAPAPMSPERQLRAGIRLMHHHALWLDLVGYRNDPLDQKLVDHVLAHVRQRVDDYFAATEKLPAQPSDKVLVSREALEAQIAECADAVNFFDRVKSASLDEQIAVGTDARDRLEAACRSIAALRSELEGGE